MTASVSRQVPFRRIVSLIPSVTETLIALGAAERIVGRTRYCIEPAGSVDTIEAVGGTKDPDCERIVRLEPDLVIMSREENRREDWERLRHRGLTIHAIHPRTVREAVDAIDALGKLLELEQAAAAITALCRTALADAEASSARHLRVRVFCPIWRKPWMTFCERTYVGSMLATCGMENVFAMAGGGRDFFEVATDDVRECRPALVLLPDEPYPFDERHAEELRHAGVSARFAAVDGKDLSWYGPRIPHALRRLCGLAEAAATGAAV